MPCCRIINFIMSKLLKHLSERSNVQRRRRVEIVADNVSYGEGFCSQSWVQSVSASYWLISGVSCALWCLRVLTRECGNTNAQGSDPEDYAHADPRSVWRRTGTPCRCICFPCLLVLRWWLFFQKTEQSFGRTVQNGDFSLAGHMFSVNVDDLF